MVNLIIADIIKEEKRKVFARLLHNARRLKSLGWGRLDRRAYLLGMLREYLERG